MTPQNVERSVPVYYTVRVRHPACALHTVEQFTLRSPPVYICTLAARLIFDTFKFSSFFADFWYLFFEQNSYPVNTPGLLFIFRSRCGMLYAKSSCKPDTLHQKVSSSSFLLVYWYPLRVQMLQTLKFKLNSSH